MNLMIMQAATAKHTNIRDVLTLFFRDDIIAWSARRSGRHASAGAGLKPAHLKQLVQLNVDKTWERLVEVRAVPYCACFVQTQSCRSSESCLRIVGCIFKPVADPPA